MCKIQVLSANIRMTIPALLGEVKDMSAGYAGEF
jgi:hypothetical protein